MAGRSKRSQNRNVGNIVLVLALIAGLCLLLYPSVANFVNTRSMSYAVATYQETVSNLSNEDYADYFAAASTYNEQLAANPSAFYEPDQVEGYEDTLDVTGTGVMGFIEIDKINVRLPIYHGTSEGVLAIGVGHIEGTSLPVGGTSTHAVLSGHRGLPSSRLFTDLDEIEVGDTFVITVLNREMTYEVDNISIVLPSEVDSLKIEEGKDLCTLVTCTPYGINSHRLLVTGHRVENAGDLAARVSSDGYQVSVVLVSAVMAAPFVVLMVVWVLVSSMLAGARARTRRRMTRALAEQARYDANAWGGAAGKQARRAGKTGDAASGYGARASAAQSANAYASGAPVSGAQASAGASRASARGTQANAASSRASMAAGNGTQASAGASANRRVRALNLPSFDDEPAQAAHTATTPGTHAAGATTAGTHAAGAATSGTHAASPTASDQAEASASKPKRNPRGAHFG